MSTAEPEVRIAPSLPGLPFVGNLLSMLRDPLAFVMRVSQIDSPAVDLNVANQPMVMLRDPALIEDVLVGQNKVFLKDTGTRALGVVLGNGLLVSEGEFWRRQRRLAQPAFHRERIASYGRIMVDCAERRMNTWHAGDVRNIHDEMMHVTMEVVARALFDADVGPEAEAIGAAMNAVAERYSDMPPGLLPWLDRLPLPWGRRFHGAIALLDRTVYAMIEQRRQSGEDKGDLLSMLLAAQDDEGRGMTDRQLRDEVITLFLAGHETTALVLTYAFMLVAQNPGVEAKLTQELHDVLGGRAPTLADMPKLTYVEKIIQETMRLYPPVWAIGREAAQDLTVGGYKIAAGTQIWLSQYATHRDPRFFPEPERFMPERWENDLARRIPKYAYFPFGGGPRLCIGNTFALMESALILATMAQRYQLTLMPGHTDERLAAVTMRPKRAVWMLATPRDAVTRTESSDGQNVRISTPTPKPQTSKYTL